MRTKANKSVAELFESGIPYMTRLAPNKTIFIDTAAENLDDLMSPKYAYRYGERLVFIKKLPLCETTDGRKHKSLY